MNNWDRFDAEQEAVQSLSALYEQARKCQVFYERAQMPVPERLARFLGMSSDGPKDKARRAGEPTHIAAPDIMRPPQGAGDDWVSIEVKDAIVTTVILAILRGAGGPVRSRDLSAKVEEELPRSTSGGVANAGTRLVSEGIISRSDEGWKLLKPEKAGIIYEGRIWGPVAIFGKQEIAAHRRAAILYILKHFDTGLQIVQLVQQLKRCKWVHAPASKDLLKLDVQALQDEKKIRRRGNTRNWELVPSGE